MENKSSRNKTVSLSEDDIKRYELNLISLQDAVKCSAIENKTINQDIFQVAGFLPKNFTDLLIIDPPYNLSKKFGVSSFNKTSIEEYSKWFESWFIKLLPILKETATVYVCGDWLTSISIYEIVSQYLIVRNRITWEREKGRGAKTNWKNASEDIWFCTVSDNYTFNVDAVKLKKKVLAPYKENGQPKDWQDTADGKFRLTYPSNMWTDLTVPYWSMEENSEHPTQKPEKLLAKLVLASSNEGDFVFDPFLGSGTSSVVAKKLKRKYCGIELDKNWALVAEKRLSMANSSARIQGFDGEMFLDRNL
jgi:site-specific DNA-methyltransferase (adenine-specific)